MRTLYLALALVVAASPTIWARSRPPAKAVKLMREGVRAYQQARLDEAEAFLTRAIRMSPGWKTASGYRAIVRQEAGQGDAARRDAYLASKLNPDGPESLVARGVAKLVLGQTDSAIRDLAAVTRMVRRSTTARVGLAQGWTDKGMTDRALQELDTALDSDPDATLALVLRGEARLSEGDSTGARADFDRAISMDPSIGRAWEGRGRTWTAAADADKGIADLRRALSLAPERRSRIQPQIDRLLAKMGSEEEKPTAMYAYAPRRDDTMRDAPASIPPASYGAARRRYEDTRADVISQAASSVPPASYDAARRRQTSQDILRRFGYYGAPAPVERPRPADDFRDAPAAVRVERDAPRPEMAPGPDSSSNAVSTLGRSVRQRWSSLVPERERGAPVEKEPVQKKPSFWKRMFSKSSDEDDDLPQSIY
jgi:Tfp pilus assembly protein PilF